MNLACMQPTQPTHHDWEWGHHPGFPSDGSNQCQLTNFPVEAWNPVWVKYLDLPDAE